MCRFAAGRTTGNGLGGGQPVADRPREGFALTEAVAGAAGFGLPGFTVVVLAALAAGALALLATVLGVAGLLGAAACGLGVMVLVAA
jgi:hypothetical protein